MQVYSHCKQGCPQTYLGGGEEGMVTLSRDGQVVVTPPWELQYNTKKKPQW